MTILAPWNVVDKLLTVDRRPIHPMNAINVRTGLHAAVDGHAAMQTGRLVVATVAANAERPRLVNARVVPDELVDFLFPLLPRVGRNNFLLQGCVQA